MTDKTILNVCISCRTVDGEKGAGKLLAERLTAETDPSRTTVREVECMSNCSRGCTAALAAPGKWAYVYGGLDPAVDVGDLVALSDLYHAADDGIVAWRDRPEGVRRKTVARIPAMR